MSNTNICCFCGNSVGVWGNNPAPLTTKTDTKCCDDCNSLYVIPARLGLMPDNEIRRMRRLADRG